MKVTFSRSGKLEDASCGELSVLCDVPARYKTIAQPGTFPDASARRYQAGTVFH